MCDEQSSPIKRVVDMLSSGTASGAVKASPGVAVTGLSVYGFPVETWVSVLTCVYLIRNAADSAVASASSATAAANSEARSATNATKAAVWAIIMDAPVEEGTTDEETGEVTEDLYSSRWYASEAKTARDEAVAAAGQNKNAVTFVPQSLTDEQKAQAVANIGALSQEVMAQAILDAFTQFNEENGFE